jgi:hypothetical protein
LPYMNARERLFTTTKMKHHIYPKVRAEVVEGLTMVGRQPPLDQYAVIL